MDHIESGAEDQVKETLKYFQNTKQAVKFKQELNDRYKEINISIL